MSDKKLDYTIPVRIMDAISDITGNLMANEENYKKFIEWESQDEGRTSLGLVDYMNNYGGAEIYNRGRKIGWKQTGDVMISTEKIIDLPSRIRPMKVKAEYGIIKKCIVE